MPTGEQQLLAIDVPITQPPQKPRARKVLTWRAAKTNWWRAEDIVEYLGSELSGPPKRTVRGATSHVTAFRMLRGIPPELAAKAYPAIKTAWEKCEVVRVDGATRVHEFWGNNNRHRKLRADAYDRFTEWLKHVAIAYTRLKLHSAAR